jgi:hypothetical protein
VQQFKLPVKNVVAGLRAEEFFLRGSIVQVTTDPAHPVMAGMPESRDLRGRQSVFDTLDGFKGRCWRDIRNRDRRCLDTSLATHLNGGRRARRSSTRLWCCSASARGAASRSAMLALLNAAMFRSLVAAGGP